MTESTVEQLSDKCSELLLEDLDQKTMDIISEFQQNYVKQFDRFGKLLVGVFKDQFKEILSDDEDGPDILRRFHSMLDEEGTNFKNRDQISLADDCAEQVSTYLSGMRKNTSRIIAHIIKTNGSYRSFMHRNTVFLLHEMGTDRVYKQLIKDFQFENMCYSLNRMQEITQEIEELLAGKSGSESSKYNEAIGIINFNMGYQNGEVGTEFEKKLKDHLRRVRQNQLLQIEKICGSPPRSVVHMNAFLNEASVLPVKIDYYDEIHKFMMKLMKHLSKVRKDQETEVDEIIDDICSSANYKDFNAMLDDENIDSRHMGNIVSVYDLLRKLMDHCHEVRKNAEDEHERILSDIYGTDKYLSLYAVLNEASTDCTITDCISLVREFGHRIVQNFDELRRSQIRELFQSLWDIIENQDYQDFTFALKRKRKVSGKMPYFSLISEFRVRLSSYYQNANSSQMDKLESLLEKLLPRNRRDVKTLKPLPVSTQAVSQPSDLILEPIQLFQRTGGETPTELDVRSERIENMKKRIIEKNSTSYEYNKVSCLVHAEECSICLSKFVDGEHVRQLHCEHLFHTSCIDSWLIHGCMRSMVCPFCRSKVA